MKTWKLETKKVYTIGPRGGIYIGIVYYSFANKIASDNTQRFTKESLLKGIINTIDLHVLTNSD